MLNNLFFLNKIDVLKNLLNKDDLNLKRIQEEIEEVARFYDVEKYNYYLDLIDPNRFGAKIPTQVPLPSCTFTLKKNITLTTNEYGNILIKYNPFFLCDDRLYEVNYKSQYLTTYNNLMDPSTFWTCDALGIRQPPYQDIESNFMARPIGQSLPTGIYSQYRLVSASVKVSYQGALEDASGIIGGTPVFFKDMSVGARYCPTVSPTYKPSGPKYNVLSYGGEFFDLKRIINQPYYKEGTCLNQLYMTYFPVDNSFLEFVRFPTKKDVTQTNVRYNNYYNPNWIFNNTSCYRTGFFWLILIKGLPVNTSCVRCEIISNFECLPTEEFLNYAPISTFNYSLSKANIHEAISMAKEDPVQIL